jgi:hypothetical protein
MTTGRGTKLTGAVGEFLVAAELCRRNLMATPFSGNVPYYDIIASGERGGHLAVQVKTINGPNWQFSIRQFTDVRLDGQRQILGEPKPEPYPGLRCVLLVLGKDGNRDRFFILTWSELRDVLVAGYRQYLAKHGGIRPKAPGSFHVSLSVREVEPFEDRWQTLLDALPSDA